MLMSSLNCSNQVRCVFHPWFHSYQYLVAAHALLKNCLHTIHT